MHTSGPGWNAVHNCCEQYASFSRTRFFCPSHAARIVALWMTLAEPMISRTSHALRVTIMLSPHDQRIANQLLTRLSAYLQQREAFGTQQTPCTSSDRALWRHSSCTGT